MMAPNPFYNLLNFSPCSDISDTKKETKLNRKNIIAPILRLSDLQTYSYYCLSSLSSAKNGN